MNGIGFESETQFASLGNIESIEVKAIMEIINALSFDQLVGLPNSKIAVHAV
jgi:hypothetical protein